MTSWQVSRTLLNYHRLLLADRVRTESYRQAIFETVRADDVVLDLGTGTGILAFFACQAGARRVYAIESGEIVEIAKQVCMQNGFQDRVVFLNEISTQIELPERVDVIVTETVGNFGLEEGLLSSVIDARDRWLKGNGGVIPRSLELVVVPVELPQEYQQRIDNWKSDLYGLDFSPVRSLATNYFYPVVIERSSFLGHPAPLVRIPLFDVRSANVRSEVLLVATRRGVLHGIAGWFTAELTEDIVLSNGPPLSNPSWRHSFFPLECPLPLLEGDRLRVAIHCVSNAVWRWQVEVRRKGGSGESLREIQFNHSTFWGVALSTEWLRKRADGYLPKLSRRGEAELSLLKLCNGQHAIGAMTQELLQSYPDVVRSELEASAFVKDVVTRCT
jgi:protein arginine N-methyltransferase 1